MDIKGKVEKLIKKYNTNCPFHLCEAIDIAVVYEDLGSIYGFYDVHYRIKTIHINSSAPDSIKSFICAHELGHAILHPTINTPFLSRCTLFSIDKIERQANTFAVELLLSDDYLQTFNDVNFLSIATTCGIPKGLELLKRFN